MKSEKFKNTETIDKLQRKIFELEDQAKKDRLAEIGEHDAEELALSFGPRICKNVIMKLKMDIN